jgi:medium-chain acyl-[acyl-carrier-protein] hydrolase
VILVHSKTPWLSFLTPRPQAYLRLFCFPYAGGDGLVIYRKWPEILPPTIEVCAVLMPGRGTRVAEPPFTNIHTSAKEIVAGIHPYLNKPFAFFGHSMGALLSFEVSRLLRRQYGLEPAHLFVSGRSAPHIPDPDPPTFNLPELEFLEELKRLNGTPPNVLGNAELMQLMLPLLRADFEACQTYRYTEGPRLSCALSAFGGTEDEVTPAEIDEWGKHTIGSFRRCMFPGEHFFINTQQRILLQILSDQLLKNLPAKNFFHNRPTPQ